MDTTNLTAQTTNDTAINDENSTDWRDDSRTRHSLLCSRSEVCPLARYCPNTGTDECDSGEGCPAC